MRPRTAFTLIELLIVIVIIGILAAIAIPQYASTKGQARVATMRSDLRNLAGAQEGYLYQHGTYASDVATLAPAFEPSAGTTLQIVTATQSGWSAKASSSFTAVTCALYYNAAAVVPATSDGVIACQ